MSIFVLMSVDGLIVAKAEGGGYFRLNNAAGTTEKSIAKWNVVSSFSSRISQDAVRLEKSVHLL